MESLSSLIFLMIINTWNTAKVLFLLVLDHLPGFYWYLNTYLDTTAGTWTSTWILLLVLEHLTGCYYWYLNTYLDATTGTWTQPLCLNQELVLRHLYCKQILSTSGWHLHIVHCTFIRSFSTNVLMTYFGPGGR